MISEWPTLTLGDVCEKITDGAHNSPKSVDKGKPMASVKDLTRFGVDLSEARLIACEDFEKLVKQGCQPLVGDVLISKDGNSALDTVCTVDEPLDAVLLSSVAILRPDKDKLDSDFLKYYFCSKQINNYLKNNFISGAAIPRVVLKDFKKAEIKVPPLDIQRKISKQLRSIDNKIFLNIQTNKTLENIAQTIFKSWFVDFEPVRAKVAAQQAGHKPEQAAMMAISGKTLDELDQLSSEQLEHLKITAALFPENLVESELGEIPKGWEACNLEDLVEIGSAKRIFSKEYVDSGVPFYRGKEVTELSKGNNIYPEIFIKNERFMELKEKSGVPQKDDILITSVGTIGNTYLVEESDGFYFKDGNLTWIKSYKKSKKPYFLKSWFDSSTGQSSIENIKIGSTQQAITITAINRMRLVVASLEVHAAFEQLIKSNFEKRTENLRQTLTLVELRDSLLPKLLSGESKIEAKSQN